MVKNSLKNSPRETTTVEESISCVVGEKTRAGKEKACTFCESQLGIVGNEESTQGFGWDQKVANTDELL